MGAYAKSLWTDELTAKIDNEIIAVETAIGQAKDISAALFEINDAVAALPADDEEIIAAVDKFTEEIYSEYADYITDDEYVAAAYENLTKKSGAAKDNIQTIVGVLEDDIAETIDGEELSKDYYDALCALKIRIEKLGVYAKSVIDNGLVESVQTEIDRLLATNVE